MKPAMARFIRIALMTCLGALALAGCGHYQLGTGGKAAFGSVYIAPVQNRSEFPQAAAIVSQRIREAFLQDGRVRLADSPDHADAVLTVTLVKYHRDPGAVEANDTGLARKFNLYLNATATLRDGHTGKAMFENRALEAQREIFTDSGQQLAEYDAGPLLAGKLAESALHAALDVW